MRSTKDASLHAADEAYREPQKQQEPSVSNTYFATVDYSRSLAQMIAAGNYDWKNGNIKAKNFPVKAEGKKELNFKLLHLGRIASTETALEEMERLSLRPATLFEFLAFSEKYPKVQRDFPIVALGSSWIFPDGRPHVAYLLRDNDKRYLDLLWCKFNWCCCDRFLAVSK